jgi:uridylate kinase
VNDRPKIKRLLLKVSGETFGSEGSSIDIGKVTEFAAELKGAREAGAEIAVVPGGGNILRGNILSAKGVERSSADNMGMLGTIINAIALRGALEEIGVETRVMTAISMIQVAEPFIRARAMRHLERGRLVILAGGTGHPFFTTDTAAALRAAEICADALLKGTKVDGVYDSDPATNAEARMIAQIGFTEVLERNLKVMDATAVALCRDNGIPIVVFNLMKQGNLKRVLEGETLGTIVQ